MDVSYTEHIQISKLAQWVRKIFKLQYSLPMVCANVQLVEPP